MSRAFVKEDVEIAERTARRRSTSGLPPGATNYLTASGAERLRQRLEEWQRDPARATECAHLEASLASATILEPQTGAESATIGARVTVQLTDGRLETYRIVGVDEVDLEPGQVSWISPIGKALLGTEVGQRVSFPGEEKVARTILKID